jgi:outer membrane protein TolC
MDRGGGFLIGELFRSIIEMKLRMSNMSSCSKLITLVLLYLAFSPFAAQAQEAQEQLTLERAVSLALESNRLVSAAEFAVEGADAHVRLAYSGYLPKIDYDHHATRGNNPVYVFGSLLTQRRFTAANFALDSLNTPAPLSNFQNKISLTQSLFDFGRTGKAVAQSRLGRAVSEKELEKTKSEVVFRVLKSYYEALFSQEMVRVAEDAVKSAAADLEQAQARFKNGLAVESDFLSVQVQHAAQSEELVKARNRLKMARSNLNFEMGLALDRSFELVRPVKPFATEELGLAALQDLALEMRPEYKQARLSAESSGLAVQSAKSEFWPTLSAFGSWETDSQTFTSTTGNNWLVGVNFRVNLFNGRADQARLAESRFQQQRSVALQDHLAQAVRLQVQNAYLELEAAGERIRVSQQAASQAEEGLRIIRNRYQAGLTTVTDLLRAETAVTSARTNHLRALFDQRVSAANLELQVGRLSPSSRIVLE